MNKKLKIFAWLAVLFLLILGACNNRSPEPTLGPSTDPTGVVETLAPVITEVVQQPTATLPPPQLVSGELIFWSGTGSPHDEVLRERLANLAQANNKSFEPIGSLVAAQITPSVDVIVSTAAAVEIQALAAQFPDVQFLAVDVAGLTPSANLHLITNEGGTLEQRSFLAGYALALVTDDYRVGAITLANDDVGNRTRDSFVTGVRYFCGLCNARFMPVDYYPFTAEMTNPSNQADWQAAADALLAKTVTAMFVQPEVSSAELITYLASKNIIIIGIEGQVGLEMAPKIVGLFGSDIIASTEQAVLRIFAGDGVAAGSGSLELKQVNRDIMSDGKRMLFERIREELLSGFIKDSP